MQKQRLQRLNYTRGVYTRNITPKTPSSVALLHLHHYIVSTQTARVRDALPQRLADHDNVRRITHNTNLDPRNGPAPATRHNSVDNRAAKLRNRTKAHHRCPSPGPAGGPRLSVLWLRITEERLGRIEQHDARAREHAKVERVPSGSNTGTRCAARAPARAEHDAPPACGLGHRACRDAREDFQDGNGVAQDGDERREGVREAALAEERVEERLGVRVRVWAVVVRFGL